MTIFELIERYKIVQDLEQSIAIPSGNSVALVATLTSLHLCKPRSLSDEYVGSR